MFTIENLSKRKSVKFTDILQAALDTLQAGGRPWFDAIARRDSVNKIAAELFKKQVYFDSLPQHYTRLSRTEDKPTVKLAVEPGEYRIEWSYAVDTSDRNPYVQYMHHLSDSTGHKKVIIPTAATQKGQRRRETVTVNVTGSIPSWLNIYPAYTTIAANQGHERHHRFTAGDPLHPATAGDRLRHAPDHFQTRRRNPIHTIRT